MEAVCPASRQEPLDLTDAARPQCRSVGVMPSRMPSSMGSRASSPPSRLTMAPASPSLSTGSATNHARDLLPLPGCTGMISRVAVPLRRHEFEERRTRTAQGTGTRRSRVAPGRAARTLIPEPSAVVVPIARKGAAYRARVWSGCPPPASRYFRNVTAESSSERPLPLRC